VRVAPEDQEAIFEEFRQMGTADKKVEGTGLGLALSRKFIELHGGGSGCRASPVNVLLHVAHVKDLDPRAARRRLTR